MRLEDERPFSKSRYSDRVLSGCNSIKAERVPRLFLSSNILQFLVKNFLNTGKYFCKNILITIMYFLLSAALVHLNDIRLNFIIFSKFFNRTLQSPFLT